MFDLKYIPTSMYCMNSPTPVKDSTRDQLLEAAKSLLWEVGYESMSPRKILERSGAGHGSLYHHFSGKADLAGTALLEIEVELTESLDRALLADVSPIERIRRFLNKKRQGNKGCRLGRLTQEASIASPTLRDPIARYFSHAEKQLTQTLQEAITSGELQPDINPRDLACGLLSIIQGGYVLSRANGNGKYATISARGALALLDSATLK